MNYPTAEEKLTTAIMPNDIVRHRPTGEKWVVCGVNYEKGELIPCGYPFPSIAQLEDCDLVEKQATRIAELEDKLQKAIADIERYDNGQGRCPLCKTDIPFQVVNDKWAFELYCPHCGVRMNLKDDAK